MAPGGLVDYCLVFRFAVQFIGKQQPRRLTYLARGNAMRTICPSIAPQHEFTGTDIQAELFLFRQADAADMEFSLASHLIILLPDQVYGVCECDTGDRIDRFRPTTPDTVMKLGVPPHAGHSTPLFSPAATKGAASIRMKAVTAGT